MAKCKIRVVTGYVRLEGHPRKPEEYYELGQKLGHSLGDAPLAVYYERLSDLWLTQFIERLPALEPPLTWAKGDNPEKNSLAYHCINHQKFAWLARAANEDQEADSIIWLDYGLMRLPGMNADSLRNFLGRIRKNDFALPGCWPPNSEPIDEYPSWRFLGSLMIVPREDTHRLLQLAQAYVRTYVRAMKKVTFEVNTLARIEPMLKKVGLRWYEADHNVMMLENYR